MFNKIQIITAPRCTEYFAPGHPERPQRISGTVDALKAQSEIPIEWLEPTPVEDSTLLRAHTPELVASLENPSDFDADTPAHPNIAAHARRSVGGVLRALDAAQAGDLAFSLLRPPGHHATRSRIMGFCYLNSIAIGALEAKARGYKRVAVFDFDVHHGNGTEDILLGESGCAFISIHQYPAYPGTGIANRGTNCFNFPVAPGTSNHDYRDVLASAFGVLKDFKPDILGISAGFDAYRGDPLADGSLEAEDYFWLGQTIRRMQLPVFSVLEGGYSTDLPQLILAYLRGLAEG